MGRQDRATSGATRAAGLTRTELPCVTRHAVLAPALRALRSLSRSSVNAIAHEAAVCCDKHAQDRHVTIFLHRIASPAASASQVYGSLSTRILACLDSDTVTVARTSHASHASGRVRTVVSASPRVGASALLLHFAICRSTLHATLRLLAFIWRRSLCRAAWISTWRAPLSLSRMAWRHGLS